MKETKQIGIYKKYLREHLSKKRYTHSLNVAASAVELAKKYDCVYVDIADERELMDIDNLSNSKHTVTL